MQTRPASRALPLPLPLPLPLLLLLGCDPAPPDREGGVQDAVVDEQPSEAPPLLPPTPPAAAAPVRVSGTVRCPGTEGPWTVTAERVPSGLQQGTGQPAPPVTLAEAVVREGLVFELELSPGPRRRIYATAGERRAWTARGAAPVQLNGPVEGLVLDCSVPDAGLPEVGRVPYARPTVSDEAWVQARGGSGGLHHLSDHYDAAQGEAALRARYRGRLSEQELAGMMPLLLQLGQDPDAADAFVARHEAHRGGAPATRRRR